MLVKRSNTKTNYILPISINGLKTFWYYDTEYLLFKAYYQQKHINGKFKPSYPITY